MMQCPQNVESIASRYGRFNPPKKSFEGYMGYRTGLDIFFLRERFTPAGTV